MWSWSKAGRAWRAKSVICGHGEQHRNNILYKLKYGRGANGQRSHYTKTAGRKCFATAENLQDQSDHQTVTLHRAWRLRSADGYLPHLEGRPRCHTFACHIFLPLLFLFLSLLTNWTNGTFLLLLLLLLALILPLLHGSLTSLCFLPFSNGLIPASVTLFLALCLWSVTLNLAASICFSSFVGLALFRIKITSGFDLLWSFWSYCGYRLNSKPTTTLNQPNTHRIEREGKFFLTMDQNDFFFPPLLSSIIKSSAFVTWRGRPVTHFASEPVNPHNLWIGTWRGL